MKPLFALLLVLVLSAEASAWNRYDTYSLDNSYGAGSPYGRMMNPYVQSRYSNSSWRNPYATNAPRLYQGGRYYGRWSGNRYDYESTSNPYGYGSPYYGVRNRYGAGSPYSRHIYVW
jgi:hypothetical protein